MNATAISWTTRRATITRTTRRLPRRGPVGGEGPADDPAALDRVQPAAVRCRPGRGRPVRGRTGLRRRSPDGPPAALPTAGEPGPAAGSSCASRSFFRLDAWPACGPPRSTLARRPTLGSGAGSHRPRRQVAGRASTLSSAVSLGGCVVVLGAARTPGGPVEAVGQQHRDRERHDPPGGNAGLVHAERRAERHHDADGDAASRRRRRSRTRTRRRRAALPVTPCPLGARPPASASGARRWRRSSGDQGEREEGDAGPSTSRAASDPGQPPGALGSPEDAERGQHDPHHELHGVLRHAGQRRPDRDPTSTTRTTALRRRGGQGDVVLIAAEGQDDEDHLEALEHHALEGEGEGVPVLTTSPRRPRCDCGAAATCCWKIGVLVVQGLVAARAQDRLAQPLQAEDQEQAADDEPAASAAGWR